MATLNQPPLQTPIPVRNGILSFLNVQAWALFFQQLYIAVNRPSYKVRMAQFLNIPPGTYGSQFVTLPAGVMRSVDFVLVSPVPTPSGTFVQVMASSTPNEVVILFHNYSVANKSLLASDIYLTVIPNANIAQL